MSACDEFRLRALRDQVRAPRAAAERQLHRRRPARRLMPMDYFVWLARSTERTLVIDTGFNAEAAARRKREHIRCPTKGLAKLDVDAAKVRDVIITHLHYDHVGNFDLFPAATFHLQDREMQFATGRHMCAGVLRHSVRRGERGRHGARGLPGSGSRSTTAMPSRAGDLGASRRRSHDGPAVRPRSHAARLGSRRLGCEPLLRKHARAATVPDGVQRRRHDPGLGRPSRSPIRPITSFRATTRTCCGGIRCPARDWKESLCGST